MKNPDPAIRSVNTEKEKVICAEIMAGTEPWITLGMSSCHLRDSMNDSLNKVFAAYVQDEIVGTFVIQTEGAFSGYLKSIAVKSDWRGKNLGTIMMTFIENEIFSSCANLFLCVSSFNSDAQRFYLKLGYVKIGVLENYLVDGYDEILMRKTIAPILGQN